MTDNHEGPENVEQRLGRVETGLSEVRDEIGGLRTEVGGLRTEVGDLRGEVNGLRIVCEKNSDDIRKVAEVQVHHGQKLDEISKALEPLAELHEFIRLVAPDHERRIQALENHTGTRK